MFVTGLGNKNGVGPAHGQSDTAREQLKVRTRQTELRGKDRREAEIGLHPLRKDDPMVEVVEIDLGGEHLDVVWSLETGEQIRRRQFDVVRLGKDGVGPASIDDQTLRVLVLGHRENAVDDTNRRLEADHAEAQEPLDELEVFLARIAQDAWPSLAASGGKKNYLS